MQLELTGRVAVVTGASKGIGLAVARTLLQEGARVVATSRRSTPELDALDVVHVAADLTDPAAAGLVVARAVEAFGGIDVLVNNAGGRVRGATLPRASFLDADDREWHAVFELNLFAAVRLARAVIPVMLARGGGAIVNVSSGNARQPSPMNIDYGAAKAGLSNVTKALSEEFAPRGIRVNTVSPGPVLTPWWTEDGGAADIIAAQASSDRDTVLTTLAPQAMGLATGRLATPQEVADVVALLASPRSASTTGADFPVDSGMVKAI
jgi:NAD(P)-dependent dehydrogenase (short-subunit alcohol dehydrogenase family)